MRYALIENGVVVNTIWLHPSTESDFPNAVYAGERPICKGDSYVDGKFYRDGEEVMSAAEEMAEALSVLGVIV